MTDPEARLRAAYDATEPLVGPAVPQRKSRPRVAPLAIGAVATAAVVALTVGAVVATRPSHSTRGSAGPGGPAASAPATTVAPSTVPSSLAPSATPAVGVAYTYRWFIHCGNDFLDFGGRTWQADASAPAYPGPPAGAGSDDGYLTGTVELTTPTSLRFTADPAAVASPYTVTFTPQRATPAGRGVCA